MTNNADMPAGKSTHLYTQDILNRGDRDEKGTIGDAEKKEIKIWKEKGWRRPIPSEP